MNLFYETALKVLLIRLMDKAFPWVDRLTAKWRNRLIWGVLFLICPLLPERWRGRIVLVWFVNSLPVIMKNIERWQQEKQVGPLAAV